MYSDCNAGSTGQDCQDQVYAESLTPHDLGATADFTSQHYEYPLGKTRSYAVSLRVQESLVPTCATGAATVSDTYTGQLFVVTGSNVESYDTDITYTLAATTLPVTITTISGVEAHISSTAAITATFPNSVFTLTVTIADVCGTSSTCTQTLTVTFTNLPIAITSLPDTASITEKATAVKLLHTITWTDANPGDRAATCSITGVLPAGGVGKFTVTETAPVSGIWEVSSVANPGFDFDVTASYKVDVQCDDLYGSSDTKTLTVAITPNQPPAFVNIPGTPNKSPSQVHTTSHQDEYTPQVTKAEHPTSHQGGNTPQVTKAGTPHTSPRWVHSTRHQVRYTSQVNKAVTLHMSLNQVHVTSHQGEYTPQVTKTCTPNKSLRLVHPTRHQGRYTTHVTKSATSHKSPSQVHHSTHQVRYTPHVIKTSTPNKSPRRVAQSRHPDYVCVSAAATGLGATVYTVTVSDADDPSTDVSVTATITPIPAPFFISQVGFLTNVVTSSSLLAEETPLYTLVFCASDPLDTVCNVNLQICLTDINIKPVINDLPLTILVPEDTGGGSQIYDVDVTDPNPGDVMTYTMSVDPSALAAMFSLNTNTGQLFLNSGYSFNFEDRTSYNMTFTVNDGIHSAVDAKVLYVSIYDVNESPVFAAPTYSLTTDEAPASTVLGTPPFICSDVDVGDSLTYRISGGDTYGRFSMASDGQLSFAQDYDVDQGTMPNLVILSVQCVDRGGLTDTATLTVTINDVNDNPPVFQQASHSISIDGTTPLNTLLTTVTATDIDSGLNSEIRYSIMGIGLGQEYFTVDTVGIIRLTKSMVSNLVNDRSFIFTVLADDLGSPSLRGYTRVSVTFTQTTTIYTPVTTPTPCFFCTMGGIAVFTLLMMIVAFLLVFGAYLIFHYCLRNAVGGGYFRDSCMRILQRQQRPRQLKIRPRQQFQQRPVQAKRILSAHAKPPSPPPPPPVRQASYNNPFWNNRDSELKHFNPSPWDMVLVQAVILAQVSKSRRTVIEHIDIVSRKSQVRNFETYLLCKSLKQLDFACWLCTRQLYIGRL
ncbi:hypothetical protein ScPMuIL_010399 [Solemya velum]